MTFSGAKLAVFVGERLLVILRDQRGDIPWPGHWDLPGGGREGGETPEDCALRETFEEVGLVLAASDLAWGRRYERAGQVQWFFAAHLPEGAEAGVRFGDEGQGWALMAPDTYCAHPLAVPHFAERLRDYLADRGSQGKTPR